MERELKTKTFDGSWMGHNEANVRALSAIADWLEQNSHISLENILSHSEEDMYLFVVYYYEEIQ